MATFTTPTNLNGTELRAELNAAGVKISDSYNAVIVSGDDLILDIADKDKAKAEPIVAAHNGTTVAPEPTIQDKLASVGLSIDDLKAALGI
jgi:hypothetical protein